MESNILKSLSMDLTLIDTHSIKLDDFYKSYSKGLFKKLIESKEKGYKMYNLTSYDKNKLEGSKFLLKDNMSGFVEDLRINTLKYKVHDILNNSLDGIKDKNVNLMDLIGNSIDSLQEIEFNTDKELNMMNSLDYIDKYKADTEYYENSDEERFYTFSHPILEKYLRMKMGWNISLIGRSADGKSILSCIFAVDFAKRYSLPVLYVTDENDKDTILEYMKCSYFGIHFRSVQDRTIKLDEYIENLSKEERDAYEKTFSYIDVWQLEGIPLGKVKTFLNVSKVNYKYICFDSFEELNSDSNLDQVVLYDLNAKEVERLAKKTNTIIMNTAQTKTDLYRVSAEKMPMLCNFHSKTLVKKNFASILIASTYNKDGDHIDDVLKLNKSRSGGTGVMYKITKNYDYMSIDVDDQEYDITKINENKLINDDF